MSGTRTPFFDIVETGMHALIPVNRQEIVTGFVTVEAEALLEIAGKLVVIP